MLQNIYKLKSLVKFNMQKIKPINLYKNYCQQVITEASLTSILQKRFPDAKKISVSDVSGGCGAMFDIFVESKEFKGLSVVKQHKSITDTLKEEIKKIHGLRIDTKAV